MQEVLKNTADPDAVKKRKMSVFIVIPIIIFGVISFVALLTMKPSKDSVLRQSVSKDVWVEVKNQRFDVEVADSFNERARGLMGRSSLPKDSGMLFVFDSVGRPSFWMYKTLIPLDIVWVSEDFKVSYIKQNAEPCKTKETCYQITPDSNAKYVVEVNSGLAERFGFNVGDPVRFSPALSNSLKK